MKKIILIIFIIAVLSGGFFIWQYISEITPSNLSHITIKDLDSDVMSSYHVNEIPAGKMFAGLNGSVVDKKPDTLLQKFDIKLQNKWGISKGYTVSFDEDNDVYLINPKNKEIKSIDDPEFFYTFKGFESLYSFRKSPQIICLYSAGSLDIKENTGTWSIKKYDDNWYDFAIEPVEDCDCNENLLTNPEDTIRFTFDNKPDMANITVTNNQNEKILQQKFDDFIVPILNKEGEFTYKVDFEWNNPDNPYKGLISYVFDLKQDFPVEFEFPKTEVLQGDIFEIYIFNSNEDEIPVVKQTINDTQGFFKMNEYYVCKIPANYNTAPGEYKIEYGIEGKQLKEMTLKVNNRAFKVQYLYIDESIEKEKRSEEAYEEYNKYFNPSRVSSNDSLYYTEEFVLPATGYLSTEYGENRFVNDMKTSYHHSGLDICDSIGSPIFATNRGKVTLSMYLTLTGNTIVIDHGQGLFSVYFHMNELFVNKGEMVERGQKIGAMGSTGFSTGSHLHFTMCFYNQNLEPGYFLVGEPITKNNYKKHLLK